MLVRPLLRRRPRGDPGLPRRARPALSRRRQQRRHRRGPGPGFATTYFPGSPAITTPGSPTPWSASVPWPARPSAGARPLWSSWSRPSWSSARHDQVVLKRPVLQRSPRHLQAEVLRAVWRRAGWPEAGMDRRRWRRLAALARGSPMRTSVAGGIEASDRSSVRGPPARQPGSGAGSASRYQGRRCRWRSPAKSPGAEVASWRPSTPAPRATRRVDLDALVPPLWVRGPADGDRFEPLGMDGRSTPLNDFFRGRRVVARPARRRPPGLRQRGIIWVVGHRIAHRVRRTDDHEPDPRPAVRSATRSPRLAIDRRRGFGVPSGALLDGLPRSLISEWRMCRYGRSSVPALHSGSRASRLALVLEWALGLRVLAAVLVQWYTRRKGALCIFPDTRIYWLLAETIRAGTTYEVLQWGTTRTSPSARRAIRCSWPPAGWSSAIAPAAGAAGPGVAGRGERLAGLPPDGAGGAAVPWGAGRG